MSRAATLTKLAHAFEMVVASVKEMLEEPDPEEWVSQNNSPLGRRRHCQLARTGRLLGAHKDGGHWFVRRRVIDTYLESQKSGGDGDSSGEAAVLAFKAPVRRGKGRGKR